MWIRIAIALCILIPAFVAGAMGSVWQTFLFAMAAFGSGRLVEMGLRKAGGSVPLLLAGGLVFVAALAAVFVMAPGRGAGCAWTTGQGDRAAVVILDAGAPVAPPRLRPGKWTGVSVGEHGACAVRDDATAWCWGSGSALGNGSSHGEEYSTDEPVRVETLHDIHAVSVGSGFACALDGSEAWCWGWNYVGAVGVPSTGSYDHRTKPERVPIQATITAVAAGSGHACALDVDGAVWCWGGNAHGQVGVWSQGERDTRAPTRVANLPPARAVDTGGDTSCAVTRDARLFCWGDLGLHGTAGGATPGPVTLIPVSGTTSVAVGGSQACATTDHGPVTCWGWWAQPRTDQGDFRRLRTHSELVGAVAVAVGTNHACALTPGGDARCWGSNYQGQLGDGTRIDSQETAALPLDLPKFQQVAVDELESCGISEGALWCWGHVEPPPGLGPQ
jgi:alpha-tubulin suppressor-like RCC1 family protein